MKEKRNLCVVGEGKAQKVLTNSIPEPHARVVFIGKYRVRDTQPIREMKKHIEFRGIRQE